MKKAITILLLSLSFIACLVSCNANSSSEATEGGNGTQHNSLDTIVSDPQDSSDSGTEADPDVPSSKDPVTYEEALKLIGEGRYEDAYFALTVLNNRGDKKAKAKLSDFHVVVSKEKSTIADGSQSFTEYTYDGKGNKTGVSDTKADGSKQAYLYENTYDQNGYLTKTVITDPSANKDIYTYEYDSKGRLTKRTTAFGDGGKYTYEYSYDDAGNITFEQNTDEEDNKEVFTYTYDESGNKIKATCSDAYGDTVIEYTYDKNGNLIKETESIDQYRIRTSEYTYDDSGNLIKFVYTNENNGRSVSCYAYDSEGFRIKKEFLNSENEKSVTEYEYDENGNMTKEELTFSDDSKNRNEYVYDEKCNLIKRVYRSPYYTTVSEYEGIFVFYRPGNILNDSYSSLVLIRQ